MVLGFFAAIMIIANLSLLTTDYFESDIDLSELFSQAQALGSEGGILANKCCPIWNVEYTPGLPWPTITCKTGGEYQCEDCVCPNKK